MTREDLDAGHDSFYIKVQPPGSEALLRRRMRVQVSLEPRNYRLNKAPVGPFDQRDLD